MAATASAGRLRQQLLDLGGLLLVCVLALQLFFVARIALMAAVDPQSTAFERSEAWRLLRQGQLGGQRPWKQQWVPETQLPRSLRQAVIASEDANFAQHGGVEWDAIRSAWDRNRRAEARAEKANQLAEERAARAGKALDPARQRVPKVVGGSTISQQLAKNLFLSGERTPLRKGQELVLTYLLEGLLDKRRILTLYLNHVELGEGVFGAEAAARHYFRQGASQLSPAQSARLAVMLPAPKRFEKNPGSAYVSGRTASVLARMAGADLP
ncbi:transglycosylase domain-containing protein [Ideonella livida]|uniref:Biosynthetic peptidoglycan transglycosylase n=1 Tax=Ideonella livida TaxID=2707176 RepID=A0A7C9PJ29_9BURK|nr:transglycosylase domain-containing protein [Ideonella livida]NDY93277.1 monofunctional biosynthetic peptidoglycan transglycosylase [Ideonella livida]